MTRLAIVLVAAMAARAAGDPILDVADARNSQSYSQVTIIAPGLPRFDRAANAVIVPVIDPGGLDAEPNLQLRTLDAKTGAARRTVAVWSIAEWRRGLPHSDDLHAPQIDALIATIRGRLATFARPLAADVPLAACTVVEVAEADDDDSYHVPCDGHAQWTCGDIALHYPRAHRQLTLTARGKTATVPTASWRLPPLKPYEDGQSPIERGHCIQAAWAIPDSRRVLLELDQVCEMSGDSCQAGPSTWHIVTAP